MSKSSRLFHPKSPLYCDALCRDNLHPFLPFCSLAALCACCLHLLTCARGLATTGSPLPGDDLCAGEAFTRFAVLSWGRLCCVGAAGHSSRPGILYPAPHVVFSFTPSTSRSLWLASALFLLHIVFLLLRLCLPALLSLRTLPSEFICQCHVTITTVNQPKSHLQHGSCFPAAASHRTHPPARVTGVAAQRDRSRTHLVPWPRLSPPHLWSQGCPPRRTRSAFDPSPSWAKLTFGIVPGASPFPET